MQSHKITLPAANGAQSHAAQHNSSGQLIKLGSQLSPQTLSPSPERKTILWNEYEQEELIGGGSFGHVYKCRHIASGKTYAIKRFKNKFQSKKKAFDQREIQILQRFDEIDRQGRGAHCPYVMKAERIEFENRKLFIVFECMDMSLTQYIKRKGRRLGQRLDEQNEIRILMKQILLGMQYLNEELGILHRDLKPDNIMVNENPLCAKIIDFGTCKDLTVESGPHTSYVSTRWYRAPECVLRSHHYNFNSDIFAAGCVMAEMYLQSPLFPGTCELDQIDKIFQILGTPKRDQWREGYRLAEKREITFNDYPKKNLQKYLPGIGDDSLLAVKNMLKISSQKRGNASEVLQLPFFKSAITNYMQTPSTQDSILGLNSPSLTIKAPKSIQKRNKSQNQQQIQIFSHSSLQQQDSSERGNEEPSNIDISNLNLHQVTESAHEGSSPLANQHARMPKIDVNQIDTQLLDTIVPGVLNQQESNVTLAGNLAMQTSRQFNISKDQASVKAPQLQISQLNQSSALGNQPSGPTASIQQAPQIGNQFMATQYKTGRYKQNKHIKDGGLAANTIQQRSMAQLPQIGGGAQSKDTSPAQMSVHAQQQQAAQLMAQSSSNQNLQKFPQPTQVKNKFNVTSSQFQAQQQKNKSITRSNFYNAQFMQNQLANYTNQPIDQLNTTQQGATTLVIKSPNFSTQKRFQHLNSTIGGGNFQIGQQNVTGGQTNLRAQIQNQSALRNKFGQSTITSKFNQPRNSDAQMQFHHVVGGETQENSPQQISNSSVAMLQQQYGTTTKKPHHLKIQNRLKNNLMIDANSTFIAGVGQHERSRSGIGAGIGGAIQKGFVSPMQTNTNGFGQLNIFNATITGNLGQVGHPMTMKNAQLRGRNNSNLNSHGQYITGNQNSKTSLHELNLTNGVGFTNYSPNADRHTLNNNGSKAKLNNSGSSFKIPTITLHNQSFLQTKISPRVSQQKHSNMIQQMRTTNRSPPPPQHESLERRNNISPTAVSSSSHLQNMNKTIYQMPSIGSRDQSPQNSQVNLKQQRQQRNAQVLQGIKKKKQTQIKFQEQDM